jgi:biopolymer transport protein ExbD
MRRHCSLNEPEEPTINLTPLIDVVFVILIMFILVAPLLELDRIELAAAAAKNSATTISPQENGPLSIHVLKDNTIMYNKAKVSLSELPRQLRAAKTQHPQARPQVFHDKQAHFGTYQAIKNAVEEAGFEQMDVILKPG